MKMHSSFVFLVVLLCQLVFMITIVTSENVHFPTDDKKCIVRNGLYWKVIQWFYGPLSFIDINAITRPNETQSINQLSSIFLHQISNRLSYKVSFTLYDTEYEPASLTYSEMFSWQGELFKKRPNQHSITVYREKRGAHRIRGILEFLENSTFKADPESKPTLIPEDGVFVIVESVAVLDEYLRGSARDPFRVNRRIFVIAVTSATESDFEVKVKKLLAKLWNDYGVADAILITPCNEDPEVVYSFFPYKRTVYGNATAWGKTMQINLSDVNFTRTDLFKKFKNMNGYPFRVTIFRRYPTSLKVHELPKSFSGSYFMNDIWRSDGYTGVGGLMLANAAKSLNFTTVNIPQLGVDFGWKADNGTFVGSIGSVLHSSVYASFNGRFLKDYGTSDIDYMFPYYFDKLCIITPKALKIPKWIAIFKCFSGFVWLILFLVICFCGWFWFFLKRSNIKFMTPYKQIKEKHKTDNLFRNVFIETWMMVLSGSIPSLPTNMKERTFIAACLFSGLIIANTFQGTLTRNYSTVAYYKDINTLEELDESGLHIGTSSGSLGSMFEEDFGSTLIRSLNSKYHVYTNFTEGVIDRVASNRDICSVERLTDIDVIIANQYENPDGSVLLHVVKDCPRSYYISYIMKKGSPWIHQFSNLVRNLFESGIVNLWYQHVEYAIISNRRLHRMEKSSEAKPFDMDDMQTAFYILFIGLLLSTMVFIGEIIVYRRSRVQIFEFTH